MREKEAAIIRIERHNAWIQADKMQSIDRGTGLLRPERCSSKSARLVNKHQLEMNVYKLGLNEQYQLELNVYKPGMSAQQHGLNEHRSEPCRHQVDRNAGQPIADLASSLRDRNKLAPKVIKVAPVNRRGPNANRAKAVAGQATGKSVRN